MKFVVTTRDPNEPDTASYIHATSDTPSLRQALNMLGGDASWTKQHIQSSVPFPSGAKQMGPVQALAVMLGEMARGREASLQVYGSHLPILPHRPYHVRGNSWFTYDHAGNELACTGPDKVVPLQPAPAAA